MICRLDLVGLTLLAGLAAAFIGGGVALVDAGVIKGWELASILSLGGVLVAAAHPRAAATTPHDTTAHGEARAASQDETLRAARGDTKAAPLHHHTFED